MNDATKAMVALATLTKISEALMFLSLHNIVKPDAVAKGCRKFVSDHPEIQRAIDSELGVPAQR